MVVDQREMDKALAILGDGMARGAQVFVRGAFVRIETGDNDEEKGCALLTVYLKGAADDAMAGTQHSLSALRRIIEKQSGSLNFSKTPGEMQFRFYLPVLH